MAYAPGFHELLVKSLNDIRQGEVPNLEGKEPDLLLKMSLKFLMFSEKPDPLMGVLKCRQTQLQLVIT